MIAYILCFATALAVIAHGRGNDGNQGDWPKISKPASKFFIAFSFGLAASVMHGDWWWMPVGIVSAIGLSFGHGNFWHDGVQENTFPHDPEKLEIITGMFWLLPRIGIMPRSKWYCRIMMAIKGGIIGAPIYPCGLALIFLWPISYLIGFRVLNIRTIWAEIISGICAGVCLAAAL